MESYIVHAHGCIHDKVIVIPNNINLIMFCYNKDLSMKCAFERFSWKFAQSRYDTLPQLITGLKQYSSTRDHFCLYRSGDVIRELEIYPEVDGVFRDGIYNMPIVFNEIDEIDDTGDLNLVSSTKSKRALKKVVSTSKYIDISSDHYLFSKDDPKEYMLSDLMGDLRLGYSADKIITFVLFQCRSLCDGAKASIPDKLSTGIKLKNYNASHESRYRSAGAAAGSSESAGVAAGSAGAGTGSAGAGTGSAGAGSVGTGSAGSGSIGSGGRQNILRKDKYKAIPMETSKERYNKRNKFIKRYQKIHNRKTIPELRTKCNEQGLTCKNADGSFMTKNRMITKLARINYLRYG